MVTKTQKFLGRSALSTGVIGLALVAAPAFAQDDTASTAEDTGTIVVTGTLIKNPNIVATSPVSVIGGEEIALRQSNTAEEILRDMPGAVASIGSAVNNGNGGASYVDLRGLGSRRNVVLLDGTRIVPGDVSGRVDLNNIPLALVERVDSLTGGASTTYGADAITGVVNFVTKKDFSGVELNISNQITEEGDGNVFRVDATIGGNFDDGKGNAVFSIGYQQSDAVYQSDRPYSRESINSYNGQPEGSGTAVPARFSVPGSGVLQIDPTTGTLVPIYASFNFNPYNVFQTPFERFNMFGQANYEVADGIEVYTRGMFSKNTVSTIIAPSGIFNSSMEIPYSNPYLPEAVRNQFCNANGLSAAACSAAAAATDPTSADFRTFTTNVLRRATEFGPRISDYVTTIFDYRLGVRGSITDTINFDVAGAYGESENTQTQRGYMLMSRTRDALMATNTTSCLSGNEGCVPLNIFGGDGSINPDQIPYLTANSTVSVRSTLAQVRALVSGDFGVASPFAEDPIQFAVGGEYRKYGAKQESDLLAQTPGELGGAGGAAPNIDGGYDVYEAYGELIAPLVTDRPFFHSLQLEAGIRYSSYSVDAPTSPSYKTTTWKAGGTWAPIEDVKLRGMYQRSVRAPNIGELFTPVTTGLTNLAVDPCAGSAPLNDANLAAVCVAQGAPLNQIGTINQPSSGQINITTGGNVNLRPEKADSYVIGAVIQPKVVPGFSLTIDYYNIKIKKAITTPTVDDIMSACFDDVTASSATSVACQSFGRNPATGGLDGDPATTLGLIANLSNLGTITTDGIDLTMNYRHQFDFATLNLTFNGNWTNSQKFKATDTSINRECVGYYSINCGLSGSIQPKLSWNTRATLSFEKVDVSFLWRHIDGVKFEPLQFEADQEAAVGCVDPNGADPEACIVEPGFRKIKSYDYFDLATRVAVSDNFDVTFTVTNLFDKKPPVVGNSIGSTTYNSGNTYPSTYDALGRRFAIGGRVRF
ncbi:TonB-dependent receptor domain-containing protein [Edaphosphingomonas haloaromaticamans]|uniref:TonB-dependent receptor domain-containing protein n=1 Tax=Edaphosphingomonas haloaromaticamans TaxID=653954 RepID=UPI0008A9622F|nr:TonB-dependent receptor [Sphingomonas haloaromaticamans]